MQLAYAIRESAVRFTLERVAFLFMAIVAEGWRLGLKMETTNDGVHII